MALGEAAGGAVHRCLNPAGPLRCGAFHPAIVVAEPGRILLNAGLMRLQNKVILVTGSATGIGKAIAKRCAAEGARVVVHGLEPDLFEDVVAEIGEDRAVGHVEDLTADGCVQRLVELALARFGQLDAVVNNAALVAQGNLHTTDLDFFRRMLEVNTIAPYSLIQAALPALRQARG